MMGHFGSYAFVAPIICRFTSTCLVFGVFVAHDNHAIMFHVCEFCLVFALVHFVKMVVSSCLSRAIAVSVARMLVNNTDITTSFESSSSGPKRALLTYDDLTRVSYN